jgi:hypothetical protein
MGTSFTTIGDLVYFGEKLQFDARQRDKVRSTRRRSTRGQ